MAEFVTSRPWSFDGWSILEFIKGRKKLLAAAIGGAIGYFIQDSVAATAIGAAVAELGLAIGEYYVRVHYQK